MVCAYSGYALAAPDNAQVVLVVGKAEAREAEGGEWRPVTVRQQLPAGASVRTGDASQMALLLKDQTQIRINQHSTLKFQSAVEPGQQTVLDLLRGRIWAQVKYALYGVTGALVPKQAMRLRAPTATIGIRGTDWDVEVAEDGKTTVTVLSGEVEMANQFGSISVGPNEQASAEVGQPPIKRLLSDARDRVQWVTAYRPTPERWVKSPPPALLPAVAAIGARDYALGLRLLEAAVGSSPEARLLLADMACSSVVPTTRSPCWRR
ncbi:MAG: FecR domain-containing protein [Sulfuritalea sp.]|nr:FecR domain-containing protein [Sulfuritalea sp.]